jgi:hypothetical protein
MKHHTAILLSIFALLPAATNLPAADLIDFPAYKGVFPASDSGHHRIGSDGVTIEYFSNGDVVWSITAPKAGKYQLTVTASCSKADDGFAEFKVSVNGKDAGKPVKLKSTEREDYQVDLDLPQGETKIAIGFTNDKCVVGEYDRNLFVHKAVLKPL